MLQTSFWHFLLNFLGRPKQAGGLWIHSQLLFSNTEEIQHFLSRWVS